MNKVSLWSCFNIYKLTKTNSVLKGTVLASKTRRGVQICVMSLSAGTLAHSRLFRIFLNMSPSLSTVRLPLGVFWCIYRVFFCDFWVSGSLGTGQSFISGVTIHTTAGSHLLQGALSGHPPSPDTSREQQQAGSPSTAPCVARAAHSACPAFVLDLFHICQTAVMHFTALEKALGMTELYSNHSLASEEGWMEVCFTVLYQHFGMSFNTGQCLFLLELRYSKGFNSAASVPPSKECERGSLRLPILPVDPKWGSASTVPGTAWICMKEHFFILKKSFQLTLYCFSLFFPVAYSDSLSPKIYEFMIAG